jgi:hypothetical protein
MQQCPKCSSQCSDELKICRTCGAILPAADRRPPQQAADDDLPVPQTADLAPTSCGCCCNDGPCDNAVSDGPGWKCPRCGQSVPGGFSVCWNCGTSEDGTLDPNFPKEPADDGGAVISATTVAEQIVDESELDSPSRRRCPQCGSLKIVPNVSILDHLGGNLQVAVDADPEALIFKDRLYARLFADVCGDCGHVEFKAEHPATFYEHYREC